MAAFTDRVVNITYQNIMPSIVDFVNNSNILTARVMSAPKNWKGITEQQPIRIANSNTGGSFDGLDAFDTSATNNTRMLNWYVKAYNQSVFVPGIEKAINGDSEKQVLSLVADRLDEAKISLANSLGDLLYGLGAGKDIEGLGLIVDDGTTTASYGGITRDSLPSVNADVSPIGGSSLSLAIIGTEFDAVSAAGSGQESPTISLTTKAVWSLYESLLTSTVAANYSATSISGYNVVSGKTPIGVSVPSTELKGASGFNAISFRGKPVVADDKCPTGTFFWLNERYLEFRRLLSNDLKPVSSKVEVTDGVYQDIQMPSFLQLKDFMEPINQFGEIGALIVMGNYICRQPRRQGKITGISS